jgi:hypothetical protein
METIERMVFFVLHYLPMQLDANDETKGSEHKPCRLLDFELEMV